MFRTASLLRPGVRLMRQMRISSKLALMAFLLFIPLTALLWVAVQDRLDDLHRIRSEQEGVRVAGKLAVVTAQVQILRGLSNRVILGDTTALPLRENAVGQLNTAIALVDQEVASTEHFSLAAPWATQRAAVIQLTGTAPTDIKLNMRSHAQVLKGLHHFMMINAERSLLLFEAESEPFFLMDIAIERNMDWMADVTALRGLGSSLLFRGDASAVEKMQLLGRVDAAESRMHQLADRMDALARTGGAFPKHWDRARQMGEEYFAYSRQIFESETLTGDAQAYFTRGSQVATALLELNEEVLERLDSLLEARAQRQRLDIFFSVAGCLLAGSVTGYLALCFYVSFAGSMRAVLKSMAAVTQGDLSQPINVLGADELAQIGGQMEQMVQRLSSIVAEIRTSAVQVGHAGQQVAVGGQTLAHSTENQAARLRESMDTVGALTEAVACSAEKATALDQVTTALFARTEAGGHAMRETVESMNTLEESTQRVAEINGVIEDLAFQTNILALNAAVEAARAGETGKGFAVVAGEVRQLAKRCSEAAAEIQALIDQTTERVTITKTSLGDVSLTLNEMVAGIGTVSSRLKEIAQAGVDQSVGLNAVIAGVNEMNALTQENTVLVEVSAQASRGLVDQANALRKSVVSIQLRQGSSDEARDLVERAIQHYHEVGSERALAEFGASRGAWVDRDICVFVFDQNGLYLAHPMYPEFVGKRLHEALGTAGDAFLRDALQALTSGSTWVNFQFPSASTGELAPKTAYVSQLSDELLIASAVHRNEVVALA